MAIYSWFTHYKWWFSIAMLVYQRVILGQWQGAAANKSNHPGKTNHDWGHGQNIISSPGVPIINLWETNSLLWYRWPIESSWIYPAITWWFSIVMWLFTRGYPMLPCNYPLLSHSHVRYLSMLFLLIAYCVASTLSGWIVLIHKPETRSFGDDSHI